MHKKNKKFIAVCLTPYHAIVASTYAKELSSYGIKSILIWTPKSGNFDISILKDNFEDIITLPKLKKCNFIKKQIIRLTLYGHGYKLSQTANLIKQIDKNSVLAIFNDKDNFTSKTITFFKKMKKGIIVLIDEGVGLYTIKKNQSQKYKLTKKEKMIILIAEIFYGMKTQNYIGENENIDAIIAKNIELLPKIKKKKRILLKQSDLNFSDIELNIHKKFNEQISYVKDYCNKFSKTICYLAQPTEEIGMDFNSDVNNINKIIDYLSNNVLLVIKPHPRDNMKKYKGLKSMHNILLLNKNIATMPFELLNKILTIKCYITTSSSVCIQEIQKDINKTTIFLFRISKNTVSQEAKNIIQSLGSQAIIPDSLDELHQIILKFNSSTSINKFTYDTKIKKNDLREDFKFILSVLLK